MVALAEWCLLSGRYPEAEPLFRDAIPIFRAAHDTKWLAIALNDYGVRKSSTGDYAVAETIVREGLEVSAELEGADRAPIAIMYGVLGVARCQQGDLTQGTEFLQKINRRTPGLAGESRVRSWHSRSTLSGTFECSRLTTTRPNPCCGRRLSFFEKRWAKIIKTAQAPLIILAELYYKREDYEKARSEIEHAMQIQRNALPADNIDLTWSRITLAKILTRTGALPEADLTFAPP